MNAALGLRIVHVSDLHAKAGAGADQAAQARVIEALLEDIGRQAAERPIDVFVFSGDLSFDGKPESLARGRELLLDRLQDGHPEVPILVTPGNHDVDRTSIDPVEEAGLSSYLADRDIVSARLADADKASSARSRLKAWDQLATEWDTKLEEVEVPPYGRGYVLERAEGKVAIGIFDSAWRSSGDKDKGALIVGADSVGEFLKICPGADIYVVSFHHPLEWLAEFDAKPLSNVLEGAGCLVLTGHDHLADPSMVLSTRGAALYCRAPCSYQDSDYSNGYAVIDIDTAARETTITLRKWIPRREVYGPDVDTAEDGRKQFEWPIPPDSAPPVVQLSESAVLEPLAVLAQEQSVIGDHMDDDTSGHVVSDYAVARRLWPVPHTEVFDRASEKGRRPKEADPIAELDDRRVVTLSGPRMSGVTTSLLWILELHFRTRGTHAPAYVRSDARFSLGRISAAISAAREKTGAQAFPVLVAIDDVKPADSRAVGRIIRLVKENPDVKFLFGCHDDEHETIANALEERLEITPGRLFLGPFGRGETRALVARILGDESSDLVHKVLSVLQRQRLPRNPLNLAALVSVIVREPDLTAVNESGLLQSYVGVLLDNPSAVDPEGLNMDYRRREHLLEEIAKTVVTRDISRIPRLEIEQIVLDYFASLGKKSGSAGQQVESLIRRRILAEDAFGVGFRYPALLHLFAAKAAGDDPEFEGLLFDDPNLYAPVIKHIAGLKRNDVETLKKTWEDAARARAEFAGGVSVGQFALISDEDGWSRIRDLDDARALVRSRPEPPSEEELDEIYDETIESPEEESPDIQPFAPEDGDGAIDRLAPAFSLAASVLQSSELITDTELRRKVLQEIIEGWSIMTVLMAVEEDMFASFRELLEPIFAKAGDEEKRLSMAEHLARLFIVNVMAITLYVEAGSIHHEQMLGELLDDEEFMAEPANALFGTMLYAMLFFPKWVERLEKLIELHGDHPMVFETVRLWATTEYQSRRLGEKDSGDVEDLLTSMISSRVEHGGPQERAARQTAVREALQAGRVRANWAEDEAIESESALDVIDAEEVS